MHFAADQDEEKDLKTQELQRNMINWVKPDLIVVSGDAVTGAAADKQGGFEKFWKKFTEPINEAQLPYAYILGNHDDDGSFDRVSIIALDDTNPLSLRKSSEAIENTTNFILPVGSSRDENELAANIWLFDTGSYVCEGFPDSYGCVDFNTIDWYDQQSQQIKEEHGTNVHHLAFLHIPIPEYRKMYDTSSTYGNASDNVCCPFVNSGFFKHVEKNGDISAMFVGHDHQNDFGGWYKDVELVYGRKSGYNAYGDIRGARVIKLKENIDENGNLNVTRNHYIVNEDGTITVNGPPEPRKGPKKIYCHYPTGTPLSEAFIERIIWEAKHVVKQGIENLETTIVENIEK
jgi:3',5'-cyclic AMP phosphodiesterase CpdA